MTLKSLIQRLLDSRTTPAEAAHSAMPSSSYVTVTATAVQAWGEMAKGVATFDGFVRVSARATSSNANVRVTNDTAAMFSQTEATASGQTQGVFVPVAKGDSWSVFGTSRDNPVVRVVKAIGGGYNSFVWRALSCLRALSNYSPRSFCKANPNGLHPRAFQKGECSCQLRLLNMFLLTMDTLAFTKTLRTQGNSLMFTPLTQLIQSLQGFAWALLRDLLHIQKLFLLEKAARSLSLMMQIQSKNYGFRRLSVAINNLGVGGALC